MSQEKPNILLITADQQRFDTAGSAGPSFMRTPHFDHLCNEGVCFTSAYADCPLCVPSRVTIMTGQSVFTHGMYGNGSSSKVLVREQTLPSYLRQLGYQTAAIGKMHFTPQRARHGFDEMILPEDYYREMIRSGCLSQPMHHGLGQNELYPAMATVPESQTLTSWTAEQCVQYIRERRDPTVPFFLWCSFSKPHPPLDPPEPYYSMYRNSPIPEPVFGDWSEDDRCPETFKRFRQKQGYDLLPREIIREARAAYYGLITQIDYNMGRVFAALQDLGLFADTLVLYTSDHGEFLGDHHTGSKIFFHEPSAHIPFVLRMPHCWENRCEGTKSRNLVSLADVLPTLLAAAGGSAPAGVDGQNLVALSRGEVAPAPFLMSRGEPGCQQVGITDGRWKYIYYTEGAQEQLFDLETDPKELVDLAGNPGFRDEKKRLGREMIQALEGKQTDLIEQGELVKKPMGT
ncbi:MAG TPA: sulfatase-like hydrolase/transferase, partial [bacterium]|nr:sulfatase-like hydrolase/transferase [bacterium]